MKAGLPDEDRRWLERSCAESGVPVVITDPRVLLDAADLLRAMRQTDATRAPEPFPDQDSGRSRRSRRAPDARASKVDEHCEAA